MEIDQANIPITVRSFISVVLYYTNSVCNIIKTVMYIVRTLITTPSATRTHNRFSINDALSKFTSAHARTLRSHNMYASVKCTTA